MADFDAIAESITFDQLCDAVGAEKHGRSRMCPLPARHRRGDKKPSVSGWRENGRLILKCHGGTCGLLGTPVQVAAEVWGVDLPEAGRRLARHIGLPAFSARREIVATYDYVDESGKLLSQVVRFRPKSFLQRRPDGDGGWVWKLDDVRRVPYRLPAVLEAAAAGEAVYVVEGEKDVHAIEAEGAVATTAPGGAGKWRPGYSEALHGAQVVIVADRDEAGEAHAWSVAAALEGIADSVRVVGPSEGRDAADHLEAGHGLDEFEALAPAEISVPCGLPHDPRLGVNEIGVYIILAASLATGTDPTRQEIADLARCSLSRVDGARNRLRDAGWIEWSPGAGNDRAPCRYRLAAPTRLSDDSGELPTSDNGDSGEPTGDYDDSGGAPSRNSHGPVGTEGAGVGGRGGAHVDAGSRTRMRGAAPTKSPRAMTWPDASLVTTRDHGSHTPDDNDPPASLDTGEVTDSTSPDPPEGPPDDDGSLDDGPGTNTEYF